MNGILIVDKPGGMTSHDVVQRVRRALGMRRVGHAGTLDPLATGVLIVLVGKATGLFAKFSDADKAYSAVMRLGVVTDSADIEGKVLKTADVSGVSADRIVSVMSEFTGEQDQKPPMFSAVKINGRKLYELARRGIEVERPARRINIRDLRMTQFQPPDVEFYMECSKGTYVRQLAADIGERLGTGACITQIRRVKTGNFSIRDAISLSDIHENHIRQWQD